MSNQYTVSANVDGISAFGHLTFNLVGDYFVVEADDGNSEITVGRITKFDMAGLARWLNSQLPQSESTT